MLDLTFNKVPSQTLYNLNYVIGSRWIFFIKLKLSLKQIMKIGSEIQIIIITCFHLINLLGRQNLTPISQSTRQFSEFFTIYKTISTDNLNTKINIQQQFYQKYIDEILKSSHELIFTLLQCCLTRRSNTSIWVN